jgi:hypothetical protein
MVGEERAMIIEGKTVEELRELNVRRMLRVVDIPEYNVWSHMKARCNNPNHPFYRHYGGRGITVCQEWADDFWAWFEHIGRRPIAGLTLERIKNDEGYHPGNIRWDTYKTQNANQRPHKLSWVKSSRYRGVCWNAHENKWQAQVMA